MSSTPARCWVLTEGIAGTENQCIGLAERLGFEPIVKRARPRGPWSVLPAGLAQPPLGALARGSDPLDPPWPEILIASGRKVVGLALALKRRAGCFTVFVQNPRIAPARFDLVVAPRHDGLTGENVFVTRTALHRVTRQRLDEAVRRFAARLAPLPRPLIAALIGGPTRRHRFAPPDAARLGRQLAAMAADAGGAIALTASRRTTGASFEALVGALGDTPATIWRGDGENPYFGYLACADAIVVTGDSISMTSEACASGKPVFVAAMPGRGSPRFDRFFEGLARDGAIRPFAGRLEPFTPVALDDTPAAAAEVRRRLAARPPT